MIIDLHIHSKSSDGKFSVEEILAEAKARGIGFLSITDHDSITCQTHAVQAAKQTGVGYVCGVELNVTFSHPKVREGKPHPAKGPESASPEARQAAYNLDSKTKDGEKK